MFFISCLRLPRLARKIWSNARVILIWQNDSWVAMIRKKTLISSKDTTNCHRLQRNLTIFGVDSTSYQTCLRHFSRGMFTSAHFFCLFYIIQKLWTLIKHTAIKNKKSFILIFSRISPIETRINSVLRYHVANVCVFGVNSALVREQTLNHLTELQIRLNGEVFFYEINVVDSNPSPVAYRL